MPFKKGQGGRPKGLPNKRTRNIEEIADRFSIDPFEVLMHFAAGDWKALGYDTDVYVMENASGGTKIGYTITPEMRLKAAQEATKYLYSQKKSVELSSEDKSFVIEVVDYTSNKNLLK